MRKGREMITFTETARQKVREYMDMSETPSLGVRVVAHRFGRHQFRYELALVMEGENSEKDVVVDQEAFEVFVDPQSAEFIEGTTVDFVSDVTGTGIHVHQPAGGGEMGRSARPKGAKGHR